MDLNNLEDIKSYLKEVETEREKILRYLSKVEDRLSKLENPPELPEELHFILRTGKKISSLKGLVQVLKEMDEDTFKHHVGENHNHFAEWISNILNKKELAERIGKIKSREEMIKIIHHYI
ncbi:MAG: DUF5752 family protein [Candidatus Woesearchaeota archaeon]